MAQVRRRTAAATRDLLARRRRPTAFTRAAKVILCAFATPQTHGRSSRTPARSKISATFWESSGDAGMGRNSIVSSASRRGRTPPSAASSSIACLMFSFIRSVCETTVSSLPCGRGGFTRTAANGRLGAGIGDRISVQMGPSVPSTVPTPGSHPTPENSLPAVTDGEELDRGGAVNPGPSTQIACLLASPPPSQIAILDGS